MPLMLERYLPQDRRRALAAAGTLPERVSGAALFADLVGFTPLGHRLTRELGVHRGVEELARRLDAVYEALIGAVEERGGSVIGFAGDALACWFDDCDADSPVRALSCAKAMQQAMQSHEAVGLKTVVTRGRARRFVVGDPQYQLIDALAGATVARVATAERIARQGEVLVDTAVMQALDDTTAVIECRVASNGERFGVLGSAPCPGTSEAPSAPAPIHPELPAEVVRSWVLPALYERERSGHGTFLTELRPAVALFLRFGGIDYDGDPAAGDKLDRVVRRMQATLALHHGALLQLTLGDKGSYAYACFGAPVTNEDDASRAVHAAHELRQGLRALPFLAPLQMGLSTGTVRTGAYGARARATYGALGDDVNLAARLMSLAGPGEIWLSEALRPAAAPRFVLRSLPPLQVKGHAGPISAHAIVGLRSARTAQRALERRYGLAMVGRQRELALIERKLVLAAEGSVQVIGIAGEAGIGKSRLVAEAVPFAQRHGFASSAGRCEAAGQDTPYLAWRSIWRALLGVDADIDNADTDDARRTALLRERLLVLAPQHVKAMPSLAQLLGMEIEDNEFTQPLTPKERASALSTLLENCLSSAAAEQPLLLVLEDVHWIDPASLQLLEDLVRAGARLPLAFVLAHRPSRDTSHLLARLAKLPGFTRIALEALARHDVARLVENKLAQWEPGYSEELASALTVKLDARAEGNPFYIEELLNYLQQRHVELNQAVAESDDAPMSLPASLNTLIQSRIDLLSESQRATLIAASVVGRHFRVDLLQGCYPRLGAMHHVQADLAELQRLDLTAPDSADPESVQLFKHVLTREVAYASLPIATREQMHGQLAAHLESIDAQRHVDLLAHHYSLSANVGKQREYLERAAVAAQRAYANEAAIGYYSRLMPLVDEPQTLTALLRERAQLLVHVGRWVDAQADCARALELAERAGETDAVAAVVEELGKLARLRGDGEAALRFWQRSLAINETAGTRRDCGRIHAEIAELHAVTGRPVQALTHMHEALGIAGENDDPSVECRMLMLGSWLDPELGEYDHVRRRVLKAAQALRDHSDELQLLAALNAVAVVECEYGRYGRAREVHQQAIELARTLGAMPMLVRHTANLARACCCDGDVPAARAAIEQTIAPMRELGWSIGLPVVLVRKAEFALLQGEPRVARESLHESLALMRKHGVRSALPLGLHLLGHVMLAEGGLPQAYRAFQEAMQTAAGAGVRQAFSSSTLVGFARLAVMTGALPEAARIAAAVRPLDASHRRPLDWYVEQWLVDVQASCRDGPSASARAEAEAEGAQLTLDEALAIASGLGQRIGERAIEP